MESAVGKEMAIVVAAFASSFLTLCGVFVNWLLNNISNTEKLRLEEKLIFRRALEEKYQKVLFGIELFMRSKNSGEEINRELSELNATTSLFSEEKVRAEFDAFAKKYAEYEALPAKGDKKYKYIADAAEDHPEAWNDLVRQKDLLAQAMREHINNLNNFK